MPHAWPFYYPVVVTPLWWIPLGVVAVAVVPLFRAGRRVRLELAALRRSVAGLRELRPAIRRVRHEVDLVRSDLEGLGHR